MLRRIGGLGILMIGIAARGAVAADLKITDTRGTEVTVTGAVVDYSSLMASLKDGDGIRVLQGDGMVMLKWVDVDSLRVVKTDESVKPPRIDIEIVLRNGRKVAAALHRQGAMTLSGRSELGEYSIPLDKVRLIVPVR